MSPIRGTTRDTIDTNIVRENRPWRLVDTAGTVSYTHLTLPTTVIV